MNKQPYFAEIIESSLQQWRGQSWQWDFFPPFGSLVAIESLQRTLFGVVQHIETGSIDPGRYPLAYQKTEEELLREQPQIFEFLRTSFVCLTVGYQETGTENIVYQLAPQPPKIHAFMRHVTPHEQQLFFARNDYLHLLFNTTQQYTGLDELLLALFVQQKNSQHQTAKQLEAFVESFALLTGNDYRRLKIFLQRIEPVLGTTQ